MSAQTSQHFLQLEQGTSEWLELRKTKITATDATVIMGASHWKTKLQLFREKLSDAPPFPPNDRMQRGLDLEPIARGLFNIQTGFDVSPAVIVKDWAMASLDGISACGKYVVEIKCPGEKDHSIALSGKVPDHYYPQLQHQMWVCDVDHMYYYSFDGADGVIVVVEKDEGYIEKMIAEEFKFYMCMQEKKEPELSEGDYVERNDEIWYSCAEKWKSIVNTIKSLEKEEDELRKQLVFLSGETNTRGAGIAICQVERKGNVDYTKIPQLKGLDLELYRKPSSSSWRITSK